MIDLPTLLTFTASAGASDLHLSAGAQPMCRIHGEMKRFEVEGEDLTRPDAIRRLIYGFLTDSQKKRLETELNLDCAMTLGDEGRFRANVFWQQRGLSAVIRVIPNKIRSSEELGLPGVVRELANLEKGLVLVTGPTGSGKSTTLASIIDKINRTRRGHIITIEDPIEFVHTPKKCMVNQREVGSHARAFRDALRAALREDPDVVLVGEMRDLETIALAITAAETGHLVFGTLHTSSASQTVDRIINVFPAEEQGQIRSQLANSIMAVIAQVLVKKRGGGRVAAHEVLVATSGARAMIRDAKSFQLPSVIQTGAKYGMQTIETCFEELVRSGQIEQKTADETLAAMSAEGDDSKFEGRGRRLSSDDGDTNDRREARAERAERDKERDKERDREREVRSSPPQQSRSPTPPAAAPAQKSVVKPRLTTDVAFVLGDKPAAGQPQQSSAPVVIPAASAKPAGTDSEKTRGLPPASGPSRVPSALQPVQAPSAQARPAGLPQALQRAPGTRRFMKPAQPPGGSTDDAGSSSK